METTPDCRREEPRPSPSFGKTFRNRPDQKLPPRRGDLVFWLHRGARSTLRCNRLGIFSRSIANEAPDSFVPFPKDLLPSWYCCVRSRSRSRRETFLPSLSARLDPGNSASGPDVA